MFVLVYNKSEKKMGITFGTQGRYAYKILNPRLYEVHRFISTVTLAQYTTQAIFQSLFNVHRFYSIIIDQNVRCRIIVRY